MSAVVKGLPELKAEFARIERAVAIKVIRRGASSGARVVKTGILPRIPVKGGTLKRSLLIKYAREKSDATQAVYLVTFRLGRKLQVGAVTKRGGKFFKRVLSQDAFYAPWVERGHKIVARFKGKYTDYKIRGRGRLTGLALRRKTPTGFVPGKFFIRDGVAGAASPALQQMVDVMTTEIDKVLR